MDNQILLPSSSVPSGGAVLNPFVIVDDAAGLVEFVSEVFDVPECSEARTPMPDGKLVHAQLRLGTVDLMLADRLDGWPPRPGLLQVWVRDVVTVLERAVARGATRITEPTPFYGECTLARCSTAGRTSGGCGRPPPASPIRCRPGTAGRTRSSPPSTGLCGPSDRPKRMSPRSGRWQSGRDACGEPERVVRHHAPAADRVAAGVRGDVLCLQEVTWTPGYDGWVTYADPDRTSCGSVPASSRTFGGRCRCTRPSSTPATRARCAATTVRSGASISESPLWWRHTWRSSAVRLPSCTGASLTTTPGRPRIAGEWHTPCESWMPDGPRA